MIFIRYKISKHFNEDYMFPKIQKPLAIRDRTKNNLTPINEGHDIISCIRINVSILGGIEKKNSPFFPVIFHFEFKFMEFDLMQPLFQKILLIPERNTMRFYSISSRNKFHEKN